MYFGNRTIRVHLLRGVLGVSALYISLSVLRGTNWRALIFLAAALYLLKGCPMCWTLGLIETLVMTIHRRSERRFDSGQSQSAEGVGVAMNAYAKCGLAVIIIAFTFSSSIAHPRDNPPRIELTPCSIDRFNGEAKCGSYEVYENRLTRRGRKITLKIVIIPADSNDRLPDPVIYIAGGPGASATASAAGVANTLAQIRQHRDLVFLDQRGTGGSHPLNCNLYKQSDLSSYFGDVFPPDDVRKCRETLERDADLTLYTTLSAVDDLDDVREALGYHTVNLFGASYGTRLALVYLKRHADHVRTVTLQGVSPTNEFVPRNFPQSAERALEGILGECDANEACHKAFPNLRNEASQVFEKLRIGSVPLSLRNVNVVLTHDQAVEGIRFMLYAPGTASRIPLILHQASQGEFTPILQASLAYRRQVLPGVSLGLYFSITCAEDIPWIKPGEGARLARDTFLGEASLRQLRAACRMWPRARVPNDYRKPTKSSSPVFVLTGEWDPVTPPTNGDATARYLSDSLHVVVPHGAHDFGDLEGIQCLLDLETEFVERGSIKGLDTSCVKAIKRRGFAVPIAQPSDGERLRTGRTWLLYSTLIQTN